MRNTFIALDINHCDLSTKQIDIWQYPLHTEFTQARQILNSDERKRADRYYFERHRRRFTIARAMLRLILAHYINEQPSQLVFSENKYGKPHLKNAPSLQFNLSHSVDLALLAIGKEFPLGIDLEFFAARPYKGIGQQMFSPNENNAFSHLMPELKPLGFFHVWAQKEALIKACGLGLSYPTAQFDVPPLPSTNQQVQDSLHQKEWHMVSFMPEVACCAALCHDRQIQTVRYLALHELTHIVQNFGTI